MAEINGRIPTELAANRKPLFDSQAAVAVAVCEMPAAHAGAAVADTIGWGVILKKGTRLLAGTTLSFSTGTASCTLKRERTRPNTKLAVASVANTAGTSA